MKILYVYNEMPGVYQHYLNSLLQKARGEMSIRTLSYKPSDVSDYNVIKYSWKNRLQQLLYKLHVSEVPSLDLKKMQEFDIVHIQHSFLWKRLLPLLTLKKRPKIVITLRGADTYLKPWTYKRMHRFFSDKSHLIEAFVVMSQHQKAYLIRWGVSEQKIFVIPISFGDPSLAKAKYPSKDKLKFISAFRMTWEKNIDGHIQFANHLKDKGVAYTYDIYGDGDDLNQLYYLVDKYNLKDQIRIKGKIAPTALMKILPDYDFFVQLSITESLGMSVIEAQSRGVPVLISNSDGLPETVVKDRTGIVMDYKNTEAMAESCIKLWQNKEAYYSFSKQAISHANSQFTTDLEVESLNNLYKSL